MPEVETVLARASVDTFPEVYLIITGPLLFASALDSTVISWVSSETVIIASFETGVYLN